MSQKYESKLIISSLIGDVHLNTKITRYLFNQKVVHRMWNTAMTYDLSLFKRVNNTQIK